jgi:hypothetical protein
MSEPIKIVRIITEEVTTPPMDGTSGSALYQVPFELSSVPPAGWESAFVNAWDHPQSFTSRHRRGIASVSGKKILLDGTTLEEVQQYHKATLVDAVERANEYVADAQRVMAQRRLAKEQREADHRGRIDETAAKIKFD